MGHNPFAHLTYEERLAKFSPKKSQVRRVAPEGMSKREALARGFSQYRGKICSDHPEYGGRRRTMVSGSYECVKCNSDKATRKHQRNKRVSGTRVFKNAQVRREIQALMRRLQSKANADASIKGLHGLTTKQLVGCDGVTWCKWIERWMQPGWTWENRGSVHRVWEIHHLKHVASYDGTIESLLRICHYRNWWPMSWVDHQREHGNCPDLVS